jgi:large subunit ribosomal protein L37Ae
MERRTVKVGITGKYGTRYGQKLRKQVKAIEILQRTKYICTFCGKPSLRRSAVGIWSCRACRRNIAGGAWEFSTSAAQTAKTTINRLKKEVTEVKKQIEEDIPVEEETKKGPKKERKPKKEEATGGAKKERPAKTGDKKERGGKK